METILDRKIKELEIALTKVNKAFVALADEVEREKELERESFEGRGK